MKSAPGLSPKLHQMLAFELSRGNCIDRIDVPAGSTCPLAVVLSKPLDFRGFSAKYVMPEGVEKWENRDPHYPFEAGYFCDETCHAISGPLK